MKARYPVSTSASTKTAPFLSPAFGMFQATDMTANPIPNNSTITNYSSVGVVSGITTTNTNWVSSTIATTYAVPASISTIKGVAQGLFSIAGITTGLVFSLNPDWSATDGNAANYATTTSTFNYDTAGAGVAPSAALNYTTAVAFKTFAAASLGNYSYANVLSNLAGTPTTGASDVISRYDFLVPFFMKTGQLEHTAYVGIFFAAWTLPAAIRPPRVRMPLQPHPSLPLSPIPLSIWMTSTNQTVINATLYLRCPAFSVPQRTSSTPESMSPTPSRPRRTTSTEPTSHILRARSTQRPPWPAATTPNITASFAATNYLSVSAMAQHSINFAPADGTFFGISPQLVLQYYDDPNNAFTNAENPTPTQYSAIPSSYVTYSQTLDATFSYNNVGYTKTTVSISGAAPATSQFGFSLNLPVAFKFKPDSWPFGLFSGSTPTASLAWQTVTSSGQTITTTVDTYTGAAITNTVIGAFLPPARRQRQS